ncbi:hypothetical protein GCM10010912_22440 [Paenibacillus albidus]|uniref:DUF2273 domain-containing protein n=1 Tax=Paenibacillus albidus TaxID=2041023 RepID=A0A917C9Y5_9BACL|nr:DUF2273 domain-containing protein [Paenibacillus albidus]MBT2290682.1 DUF2273 domain-containing protein [Paenibacillus albidus]GGF76869.1 hypothetical protein GCM10010912_22440 [Paenibacillus albidus]
MPWKEVWESHGGRIAGVAFSFILGLIYLFSGFWDMLFFALVVFIGYTFGKRKDNAQPPLFQWQELVERLSGRWRPFK